jgi:GR25 family glycosyltransferase involved in LPS biosynthesis
MKIPTFIINLEKRTDRKAGVLHAFKDHDQFDVQIVTAEENSIGAVGLWNTIQRILAERSDEKDEYILICEDDHQFTDAYTPAILEEGIRMAKALDADILLGGISWCNAAVPVTPKLFWISEFSGLQFTIVFRKFFGVLRSATFGEFDKADFRISTLAKEKFVLFPFISVQKDYGYSDVTEKNGRAGRIDELFAGSSACLEGILKVRDFYAQHTSNAIPAGLDPETVSIPVYVINLPQRTERRAHILQQFEGRREFEVNIIEACRHEPATVGLWLSIRKIVAAAKEKDEDVIVICEDDHAFTADYSRDALLRSILVSHGQNIDYINGGSAGVSHGIMIGEGRFWASGLLSGQFIIIYSKFFDAILEEPYDETVIADMKLSEMTSNKVVLFPFISVQKDFGYSDVTPLHNEHNGIVSKMFEAASRNLSEIKWAQERFTSPEYR